MQMFNDPTLAPPKTFFYTRRGKKSTKLSIENLPTHILDYALLSAKVYLEDENDVSLPIPSTWTKWKKCDVIEIPEAPSVKHKMIGGMGYELWEKKVEDKYLVAIVFRGTDFSQMSDWYTNLRWLRLNFYGRMGYEARYYDQYHQVRQLTPKLVERIKSRYGHSLKEIVVTGHSLGGGLAHQASYCCSDIKTVIAFDPSPVTGYMDVPLQERTLNQKGTRIERIYQKGEVLSYLRSFLRLFYRLSESDPEIVEFELDFVKGNLIAKHSIQELALSLAKLSS